MDGEDGLDEHFGSRVRWCGRRNFGRHGGGVQRIARPTRVGEYERGGGIAHDIDFLNRDAQGKRLPDKSGWVILSPC